MPTRGGRAARRRGRRVGCAGLGGSWRQGVRRRSVHASASGARPRDGPITTGASVSGSAGAVPGLVDRETPHPRTFDSATSAEVDGVYPVSDVVGELVAEDA